MKAQNKNNRKSNSIKNDQMCARENRAISELILEARKYYDLRQLVQANHLYQQVLQLQADNITALNALGMIAMETGMLSIATEIFDYALAVEPENMILNKNQALVYTKVTDFDSAIKQYLEILNLDKSNADAHGELARLYLQTGKTALSLKYYHLAYKLNPSDPRNFHGLLQLDAEAITEHDINMIESLLCRQDLPLDDRRSFYFALGAVYDASERYDEAFANYAVANISKAVKFDSEKHVEYINNIMNTFSAELFQAFDAAELYQSAQPVFIVGMPRSGTTLVEQYLSSHTDVYAGGELNLVSDIAQKLKLTMEQLDTNAINFEYNSAESLSGFARYYINDINSLAINSGHKKPLRITDKMPTNFIYLGLIALLFPNAQVIHCRRNPLDVSLSCYFHDFAGDHGYACDLKDIGLYYQQYERLMEHWKQVLPMKIHTVEYEAMVKQSSITGSKLIEFVGLDPQSVRPQSVKTSRSMSNAEVSADREVMYQSPVERWCYYEKYLHTLRKTLNALGSEDISAKKVTIQ